MERAKGRINNSEMYEVDLKRGDSTVNDVELELYLSGILNESEVSFGDNVDTFRQVFDGVGKFLFFVGYRQTGKSVFLKYCFGMKSNTPYINEELKCFVIPLLGKGNPENKTPYDMVSETIRGACDRFEYEYLQADQQFTESGVDGFFRFILDTRASYLPELGFSEESKLTTFQRKCARINKMQEKHKLAFYLTRLKYYLMKYSNDIEKVVVVLDNIHNMYTGIGQQQEMISLLIDVFECLGNDGINGKGKWSAFVVAAVRPAEYRKIKTHEKIASYADMSMWHKVKVNSAELFNRAVGIDADAVDGERVIGVDSETVLSGSREFRTELAVLSRKFDRKYADMIERLCFYSADLIRQAYKRILLNTTWVREKNFRFSVEEGRGEEITFNNITCIRALACGDDKVYRRWGDLDKMAEIDKLLPNILYNEENADYGLLNLYTMKYYLRQYEPQMEWGEKYIVLKDYVDCFTSLLGIDTETCVFVTDYLFRREILRKSFYDVEEAAGVLYNQDWGTDNKLYITSRGKKMWDMFRDDSVLLELCREDMYLEEPANEDEKRCSYDLMIEKKQCDLFLMLLKIIGDIFEQELSYYQAACRNGNRERYRKAFGRQPVALILLEGVTRSIQYSGYHTVMKDRNELESRIFAKWKEWGD